VLCGHSFENLLDGDVGLLRPRYIAQGLLGGLDGPGVAHHSTQGEHPVEGALQLADVARHLLGDILEHTTRNLHALLFRLGL